MRKSVTALGSGLIPQTGGIVIMAAKKKKRKSVKKRRRVASRKKSLPLAKLKRKAKSIAKAAGSLAKDLA